VLAIGPELTRLGGQGSGLGPHAVGAELDETGKQHRVDQRLGAQHSGFTQAVVVPHRASKQSCANGRQRQVDAGDIGSLAKGVDGGRTRTHVIQRFVIEGKGRAGCGGDRRQPEQVLLLHVQGAGQNACLVFGDL